MWRCTALALAVLAGCQEYRLGNDLGDPKDPGDGPGGAAACGFTAEPRPASTYEVCSDYQIGDFTPWVEYSVGRQRNCTATPTVADLDGDGVPEIIGNFTPTFGGGSILPKGELWVIDGQTAEVKWKVTDARLGYGAPLAVGDIDGDGDPEIVGMRALTGQTIDPLKPGQGEPQNVIVAWDHEGNELWQSAIYGKLDFDYATAPILTDMDRDGEVEIVAGRVILRADGTERGRGTRGRGSYGVTNILGTVISEATVPAVADVDLDGIEEVIVGNAMYTPDGDLKWSWTSGCRKGPNNPACQNDGMIAVANLDDDPEAEWVASTHGTIRAHDTDGSLLWGPFTLACVSASCAEQGMESANIVSNAAIDDIDNDGWPEIVVAGGSQIVAFNHDGTQLWANEVQDLSGATGASIFDFDADGVKEVVYADEVALYAFDGATGEVRFRSHEHSSNTMMEYPVVVDVDADGSAEILVPHFGMGVALTVYGASDGNWAPTRKVWNQHAYSIDNIEDDLSIPTHGAQGFTSHNSWHSASDPSLDADLGLADLQVEVVDVCRPECAGGVFTFAVQALNRAPLREAEPGVKVSVYARRGGQRELVQTLEVEEAIAPGAYGQQLVFEVPAKIARRASAFEVVVDDDGSGRGAVAECVEADNVVTVQGPFCR